MASRVLLRLLALLAFTFPIVGLAQEGQPVTGEATTYHIDLHTGSNLVSLPVLPDSAGAETEIAAVVADLLPLLTLVQDDEGRYFIPSQGIADLDVWEWNKAYRVVLAGPTTLAVQGPAIQPEVSPLLLDHSAGNWVPYLRNAPASVDTAFASVAPYLLRVEDAEARFYVPGDATSTLDSVHTGYGYKVWVDQPAVLTYPANSPSPDTTAPAAPTGLVATAVDGAVVLDWDDNVEGDLPTTPYEVLRSTVSGGAYTHVVWQGQSDYTDASDLTEGATYYYVITARDAAGNASPVSAEASATLALPPPSPGPFALPASPSPTATAESLGLRVAYRGDNRFGISGWDVQGERLWFGTSSGVDIAMDVRPPIAIEPDGSGGIVGKYLRATDSTLTELPPLGTDTGTGGYPDYMGICGEWSPVGGYTRLPSGGSAITFLIGDGLCHSSNYTLRFIEEGDGSQRTERYTLDGSLYSGGNKNNSVAATQGDNPFLVLQQGGSWPNLLTDGDLDGDLHNPVSTSSGQWQGTFEFGVVADTIWVFYAEDPALAKLTRTGPDEITVTKVVHDIEVLWGTEFEVSNGYGATPRYVGPAGDNPGFLVYSSSDLDYHTGATGTSVTPISGSGAGKYLQKNGETWRLVGLNVQRLDALDTSVSPAVPTWVTEITLSLPVGWTTGDIEGWELTDAGSIYLFSESIPALDPSGDSVGDIAVAYYKSAGL